MQGSYSSIYPEDLRQIPIASNADLEEGIEIKVNQILLTKKENPAADTSFFEAEIDRLVYELYGLTEEEIEIVEK